MQLSEAVTLVLCSGGVCAQLACLTGGVCVCGGA